LEHLAQTEKGSADLERRDQADTARRQKGHVKDIAAKRQCKVLSKKKSWKRK